MTKRVWGDVYKRTNIYGIETSLGDGRESMIRGKKSGWTVVEGTFMSAILK